MPQLAESGIQTPGYDLRDPHFWLITEKNRILTHLQENSVESVHASVCLRGQQAPFAMHFFKDSFPPPNLEIYN